MVDCVWAEVGMEYAARARLMVIEMRWDGTIH